MANAPLTYNSARAKQVAPQARDLGWNCQEAAGAYAPIVDRNSCEGKYDCIAVCPYDVFEPGVLSADERRNLSLKGKIKAWAHKGKTVYTPRADACQACGHCVVACPEKAITLAAT